MRSTRMRSTKKYTPVLNRMSTTLNAPTYQSVNRMRSGLDIAVRFPRAEHVPLTAQSAKQFRGMALINFAAEALDVDLNQVGKRIKCFVPNMLGNLGPAHYAIDVARKVVK